MSAERRLERIVDATVTLASPPVIFQRLMRVMHHPRSGALDVARVLSEDPGLTARLLRLVNSAMFSFPRRVESITHAVQVVGTVQIRDLALAATLTAAFRDVSSEEVTPSSFWLHSLATGVTARTLASMRREPNVERFFVAGLLHDVGRLALFACAAREMGEAITESRIHQLPLREAEERVLGFDHAAVGESLLRRWNLPDVFQEAAAYHHRPAQAYSYPVEVAAVHLGDVVATGLALGSSGEIRVPPLDRHAWKVVAVDPGQVHTLVDDIRHHVELSVGLVNAAAA